MQPNSDPKKALPVIKDDYGNIVNPYIPRFIVKTPWYVTQKDGEGEDIRQSPLEHQRVHTDDGPKSEIMDPVKIISAPSAKKFKKGACENCGAQSHTTKDCAERPRAKGAKVTGIVTGSEVTIKESDDSFAAKRDRWRGYEEEEFMQILETRKADLEKPDLSSDSENSDSESEQMSDANAKQLRIREDTAKYLKDIRSDSTSSYDPKTRSMRESNEDYDAFVPANPQAMKEQVFAWQDNREPLKRPESASDSTTAATTTAKNEEELKRIGVDKKLAKKPNDHRYNY